jgi:hypothetical protein
MTRQLPIGWTQEQYDADRLARQERRQQRATERTGQFLAGKTVNDLLFALDAVAADVEAGRAEPAQQRVYQLLGSEIEARHPEILPVIAHWLESAGQTAVSPYAHVVYEAALREVGVIE